MINGLGESMLIVWAEYGVIIENINESTDNLTFWISVPKYSYKFDVNNNNMSGMFLAQKFKKTLTDMGVKRLCVKCKIRDEMWTENMGSCAATKIKKELYGSQW